MPRFTAPAFSLMHSFFPDFFTFFPFAHKGRPAGAETSCLSERRTMGAGGRGSLECGGCTAVPELPPGKI